MTEVEEIFLAYDIRGAYPTMLNEAVALRIGEILSELLSSTEILVGYDNRSSSVPLAKSLVEGLRQGGKIPKLVGFIANGAMYHAAWKMELPAAYITASHVPPPVNGLKLIKSDGTSFLDELKVIKEKYLRKMASIQPLKSEKSESNEISSLDHEQSGVKLTILSNTANDFGFLVKKNYISFLVSVLREDILARDLNIAIDAMNGATTSVLRDLFQKIKKIHPILLRCPPADATPLDYGGIVPEPSASHAQKLITVIKDENSDFGVMFDGDGDRALFIDNQGRPLDGTLVTAIFAQFLLKEHPGGTVVVPVDATQALTDVVLSNGGHVEYVRIGHSFIEQAIRKEKVILCGESSHHYYFPKICPFSDGILSMIVLSHYLARNESIKLSRLVEALPKYVLLRKNTHFRSHAEKNSQFEKFKHSLLEIYDETQFLTIDGVKVHVDESSWFLVRPSNTEPVLRLIVESRNKEKAISMLEQVERWLKSGRVS